MHLLAPALVALVALITLATAQTDFPYCGTGAWQSTSYSPVPQNMGGIKITAYDDKTLHVNGVFSNLPGSVRSVKIVTNYGNNSNPIEVIDLTDAFAEGVTSGVIGKSYNLSDKEIFGPQFLKHIKQLPIIFHYSPSFFLLNFLNTQYAVVMQTSGNGSLHASLGSCFQRLCFSSELSSQTIVPTPVTQGSARVVANIDTEGKLILRGEFKNLNGTTIMAHIHAVTAVANVQPSGPATTLPSMIGFPLGLHEGKFDVTLDLNNATSFNSAFIAANGGNIFNASNVLVNAIAGGHAYMNIHTTVYQAGEIAGFFTECGKELLLL